ncbi:hypothetical protein Salat_1188800 [Sesamum alatum]|uniref:Secreted protein n=1 Tax=Sesamum alatum TaxID=300844 RepID=A0AAE1YEX0_9LAMI|nr:hypothetical protein Salat_1188800 [Sesamum alatum]
MKGAADELFRALFVLSFLVSSCASNPPKVVSRDCFPRRRPITENTLRHVSGHTPRQSDRRPPIYTLVPRPTPHAPALARRAPVMILDFLLFSAPFTAILTTHAGGSPPFDSTPRGDHFEPSPTHFGQGFGDRLPLARELSIIVVTPLFLRSTPAPPSSTLASPSSKLTDA